MLYPTLVANCQWWGPVITRFQTSAPEVWITIDDGPSPAHTIKLLDILDRFEARATFFVVGANAEKHPHLITEILTRGHALGNHTFMHPSTTVLVRERGEDQKGNRSLRGDVTADPGTSWRSIFARQQE